MPQLAKQLLMEKEFLIRLEPQRSVRLTKVIRLARSNGSGGTNWGRSDHGNATKSHNQTEVESAHGSVAVV